MEFFLEPVSNWFFLSVQKLSICLLLGVANRVSDRNIGTCIPCSNTEWSWVSILFSLKFTFLESFASARVGIANAFMSLGCLASGPVQGALLSTKFKWVRPVTFTGVSDIAPRVFQTDPSASSYTDPDDKFNCGVFYHSNARFETQRFAVDMKIWDPVPHCGSLSIGTLVSCFSSWCCTVFLTCPWSAR